MDWASFHFISIYAYHFTIYSMTVFIPSISRLEGHGNSKMSEVCFVDSHMICYFCPAGGQ